jgi:hypothetical protein
MLIARLDYGGLKLFFELKELGDLKLDALSFKEYRHFSHHFQLSHYFLVPERKLFVEASEQNSTLTKYIQSSTLLFPL